MCAAPTRAPAHTVARIGHDRKEINMTYSFAVRGASKAEAESQVATELDKVVTMQPDHRADRDGALTAAKAFIALLPDDLDRHVAVSMTGYISSYAGSVNGASVTVNASLVAPNA